MSMVLSFTQVSPQELDRAFADPEWAEEVVGDEDRPDCDLDKAWAGIQFLLDAAKVDVDLYEDGDAVDEECTLFGWSASMVADAAKALGAVPFDVLARHYDAQKLNEKMTYPMRHLWSADDLGYLATHHVDLVTFFADTSTAGAAAIRCFSF